MNGRCDNEPNDPADNVCDVCAGEFCDDCLVYPRGKKKPPVCKPCAIATSGVRSRAARQPSGAGRNKRKRRKELKAEVEARGQVESTFKFFDEEGSGIQLSDPGTFAEPEPEPKKGRRFGRKKSAPTENETRDEPKVDSAVGPEPVPNLGDDADEDLSAALAEAVSAVPDPQPSGSDEAASPSDVAAGPPGEPSNEKPTRATELLDRLREAEAEAPLPEEPEVAFAETATTAPQWPNDDSTSGDPWVPPTMASFEPAPLGVPAHPTQDFKPVNPATSNPLGEPAMTVDMSLDPLAPSAITPSTSPFDPNPVPPAHAPPAPSTTPPPAPVEAQATTPNADPFAVTPNDDPFAVTSADRSPTPPPATPPSAAPAPVPTPRPEPASPTSVPVPPAPTPPAVPEPAAAPPPPTARPGAPTGVPGSADTDASGNWIPPVLRGIAPKEVRDADSLPRRRDDGEIPPALSG